MAANKVGSYAPKVKTVTVPRPGGKTLGSTGQSNAPTKPETTPALHKQYAAGVRVLRSPKTQGLTRQGRQIN